MQMTRPQREDTPDRKCASTSSSRNLSSAFDLKRYFCLSWPAGSWLLALEKTFDADEVFKSVGLATRLAFLELSREDLPTSRGTGEFLDLRCGARGLHRPIGHHCRNSMHPSLMEIRLGHPLHHLAQLWRKGASWQRGSLAIRCAGAV